jgi:soluble lytic murein transglycosylase-like protein
VILEGSAEPVAPAPSVPKEYTPREVSDYDLHLKEACARYRIPEPLARAILASESNFNPGALSHAGAVGLMQLMPETAVSMYVDDIYDPRENIQGGVRYLRVLTNQFDGDLVKVIAAYNAGPNAVIRANGIPEIAETKEYVQRVLKLYAQYKQQQQAR